MYARFFPPYFSCPFCRFSIFGIFIVFFYFLYSFMKMKAYTVCARPRASIFMVFWLFSQKNICQISSRFFTNCVRNIIEKAVSIYVILPQNRKVQKIPLTLSIKVLAQRYGDKLPKKSWKALKRKMQCTLHASMVSEGFANFIPKDDRPAN